jgi:RND family efflux transporter MFP subunit
MSRKKIAAIAAGVALLLGGGAVVRQNMIVSGESSAIQTSKVLREDFVKTVSSSGKTKAQKSVDLKFQTSGRLNWVGVKEGDHVRAYQAIAGMDQREVQKNLQNALLDYSKERNAFEEWNQNTNPLCGQQGLCSDSLKRVLQNNQGDLTKSVNDVELKALAIEFSTLVTPIGGIVTSIDTPVAGINITPATAVFTVVDPSSIEFEANADETDVGNLALGQKAMITLDAYPEATFSGTISYISYASQVSAGGATVFPVRIAFDNPADIRIGLNGDVTIDSVSEPGRILVPIEAIREDSSGKYVYKKTGQKYVKTSIHTGMQNDTNIVVTDGLAQGDSVVTKGFTSVKL